MQSNIKNVLTFISLFLIVSFISVVILNVGSFGVSEERVTATVLDSTSSSATILAQINSYTLQAESLSKNINNKLLSFFLRENYKTQLNSVLLKRKELIISALSKGVDVNSIKTLSPSVVSNTSDANLIEKNITIINGQVNTLLVDDFENYKSSYRYKINFNSTSYSLAPNKDIGYISGTISLTGIAFGSVLYAIPDVSKIVKSNGGVERSPENPNSHNTLVILINLLNTTTVPFSKDEAKNLVFNGQFNKFMKEQSYGKANFSGDVFGWLTLNSTSCYPDNMQPEIDAFAIANNINISNYDHLIYVFNCFDSVDFKSSGWSSIGKMDLYLGGILGHVSETTIRVSLETALADSTRTSPNIVLPFSWTNFDFLLAHEMGHALGLNHASGLDCYDQGTTSPCKDFQYGNTFDVMGNGRAFALHYNSYHKKQLGWLSLSDTLQISQAGVYKLSPLEIGSSYGSSSSQFSQPIGKRLAVIQLPGANSPIYTVEYRAPIGFDIQLNQPKVGKSGLYINRIDSCYDDTCLIDSQPTDLDWVEDTEISFVSSNPFFVDQSIGLTIKPLGISGINQFSFEVMTNFTECVHYRPKIIEGYNSGAVGVSTGMQIHIWQEITNSDHFICDPSDFHVEILPNAILSSLTDYYANDIYPIPNYYPNDSKFQAYLSAFVNAGVAPGVYPIEIKATNTTSGLSKTKVINITVTP